MNEWGSLGKMFLGIGSIIALMGLLLLAADRFPAMGSLISWFGKLPGDITIRRDHFSFSLPLATSLLLSVVLSLLFYVLSWIFRR